MGPEAAVAARLRSLFEREHESLEELRRLMAAQEGSLRADAPDRFEQQVEAERGLLDRLEALRHVSDAFEATYRAAFPQGDPRTEAARVRVASAAAALAQLGSRRRLALASRRAVVAKRLRALRRLFSSGRFGGQEPPRVLDILR